MVLVSREAAGVDICAFTFASLIFHGSRTYPYNGALNCLSARAFASGTDAWTSDDHTCFTLTTVGEEGFLQILPVYLDHILHPSLTMSSFITEVGI